MRPESYKLIAKLFESFISEDSSAIGVIGNLPGGKEVAKKLHQELGLSHNQEFKSVPKIAWSELKDMYRGAWVLIKGTNGTGAIRARNSSYESLAFDPTSKEIKVFKDSRGGNNIDFLKNNIGKLVGFYVGKESGTTAELQRNRQSSQSGSGPQKIDSNSLVKKFKPLWLRSMQAAQADVKGMIATMIKNDAFEKAERKLAILKSLQRAADTMELGSLDEAPEWLQRSVSNAILMAASHHYPELTGDIERSRYGGSINSQNPEGPTKLLNDIANGDTSKLGTILGFFKRNLITG
jgi:hypothetical protein